LSGDIPYLSGNSSRYFGLVIITRSALVATSPCIRAIFLMELNAREESVRTASAFMVG
jgi:hypothetical protein